MNAAVDLFSWRAAASAEQAAFAQFDREHPEVWRLFERFTLDLIARGWSHYSADAVLHRVRWETDAGAEPGSETFKINNNWTAHYARKFRRAHPAHAGFFRLRRSQADGGPDDAARG